jgi:flagellar motor switch protein FliG
MSDGVNQSAILLMALGEESASEVLRQLEPKQVQKIVAAMTQLQSVPKDSLDSVLELFSEASSSHNPLVPDTSAYIKAVVNRALGEEKAEPLLSKILGEKKAAGINSLRWMEGDLVADLLKKEHPQVIATVLAHLDRDHAATVLKALPDDARTDVVSRVATLSPVHPSALEDLDEALSRLLTTQGNAKTVALGGVKAAAEILNHLGSSNQIILEAIEASNPELSQKLSDQMFVFADLINLTDKAIQTLLREIPSDALIIAMKGSEPELRDKFFKNMSQRAAETVRDDLESKGPVRLSDVEAQHKEILVTVKRLAQEGQLTLPSGGSDDGFV